MIDLLFWIGSTLLVCGGYSVGRLWDRNRRRHLSRQVDDQLAEILKLKQTVGDVKHQKALIAKIDRRKDKTIEKLEAAIEQLEIDHAKFINENCPGITITKT